MCIRLHIYSISTHERPKHPRAALTQLWAVPLAGVATGVDARRVTARDLCDFPFLRRGRPTSPCAPFRNKPRNKEPLQPLTLRFACGAGGDSLGPPLLNELQEAAMAEATP